MPAAGYMRLERRGRDHRLLHRPVGVAPARPPRRRRRSGGSGTGRRSAAASAARGRRRRGSRSRRARCWASPCTAVGPEVVVLALLAVGDHRRAGGLEALDRVLDRRVVQRLRGAGDVGPVARDRGQQLGRRGMLPMGSVGISIMGPPGRVGVPFDASSRPERRARERVETRPRGRLSSTAHDPGRDLRPFRRAHADAPGGRERVPARRRAGGAEPGDGRALSRRGPPRPGRLRAGVPRPPPRALAERALGGLHQGQPPHRRLDARVVFRAAARGRSPGHPRVRHLPAHGRRARPLLPRPRVRAPRRPARLPAPHPRRLPGVGGAARDRRPPRPCSAASTAARCCTATSRR